MRRVELQVAMRRFSRMHSHFLRMISSDPANANTYRILVDHYKKQYSAIGDRISELDRQKSEGKLARAA